jgi:mannose/fructose/N-acetylgalactosamine-specific phosphotransferase system component IIC
LIQNDLKQSTIYCQGISINVAKEEIMFVPALLAGIVVCVCFFIDYWFGYIYTNKPIIIGTFVGLFLGDLPTGIICGATYELIFLGAVNIGGSVPAEPSVGAALGTALVILYKMQPESAVAIAVPAGLLSAQLTMVVFALRSVFTPFVDRAVENDDDRKITILLVLSAVIRPLVLGIVTFAAIFFGGEAMSKAVEAMPKVITGGISVASGMLAVVGFSLLLKVTWTRNLAIWFFVGAALSAYLNIPILGIAILGVIYCIVKYFDLTSMIKLGGSSTSDVQDKTGGFFND